MNIILDIILAIPLIWAVWAGFRNGIIVQLGGIAGILLGAWLSFRYGTPLALWLGVGDEAAPVVGFLIILVAVILLVALFSHLMRGVMRLAGLATLDRLGGALLSLLKVALILGLLLHGFVRLNRTVEWVDQRRIESAVLYRPLTQTADLVCPYINKAWDKMFGE
jgi:membrane protein required for colicin V production